jgi:CheY-like chemotaxis protein
MAESEQIKPKVAIIEDNHDSRELLRILLQDHYDVVVYRDGQEALSGIVKESPAVILCDLLLPDYDGQAVMKELRNQGVAVPIIAVSAHVTGSVPQEMVAEGFDAFVPKPILDLDQFLESIHAFVHNGRQRSTTSRV